VSYPDGAVDFLGWRSRSPTSCFQKPFCGGRSIEQPAGGLAVRVGFFLLRVVDTLVSSGGSWYGGGIALSEAARRLEHYIWVNVRSVQESGQKTPDSGHLREKEKMLSGVSIYMETESSTYGQQSCFWFFRISSSRENG
jgi:hypothetical protein